MKPILFPLLGGALIFACECPAQSATDTRALAAACTACHNAPAAKAANAIPPLAGADAAKIIAAMKTYKEGTRPGTVMPQLARGLTDAEAASIAGWFERQKDSK